MPAGRLGQAARSVPDRCRPAGPRSCAAMSRGQTTSVHDFPLRVLAFARRTHRGRRFNPYLTERVIRADRAGPPSKHATAASCPFAFSNSSCRTGNWAVEYLEAPLARHRALCLPRSAPNGPWSYQDPNVRLGYRALGGSREDIDAFVAKPPLCAASHYMLPLLQPPAPRNRIALPARFRKITTSPLHSRQQVSIASPTRSRRFAAPTHGCAFELAWRPRNRHAGEPVRFVRATGIAIAIETRLGGRVVDAASRSGERALPVRYRMLAAPRTGSRGRFGLTSFRQGLQMTAAPAWNRRIDVLGESRFTQLDATARGAMSSSQAVSAGNAFPYCSAGCSLRLARFSIYSTSPSLPARSPPETRAHSCTVPTTRLFTTARGPAVAWLTSRHCDTPSDRRARHSFPVLSSAQYYIPGLYVLIADVLRDRRVALRDHRCASSVPECRPGRC